ncbi:sigma-54-dependent transcriptional regulator [Desulfoferula mesophila]|uniref:Acetoacetate metabolism regulatory protein AtoC n=1 Tax=Desulfoferula mesophila TaxID=3058419 RepID=A0AAU9EZX0_9BACT|nr:acetoacetate metabolism regulatory protein AtoC [Desulfoferula mesophilus]
MSKRSSILVVDDEAAHRLMLTAHLEEAGYNVLEAPDGEAAVGQVEKARVDLVIMDLVMPRIDGMEALKRIKSSHPDLPVMMMTAYGSIDNAVKALKLGAADYITKPLDVDEVLIKIERQLKAANLARRVASQAERLGERFDFSAMVGESPPMRRLKETMALVAPSQATVLITGESGTGKEVAAQILHQNSPRADGPLIKVNCAALPENLLESELFGHEKGSFTGATSRREGRLSAADGGTLFLDEVGEMTPALQAKLLRALQEGEYSPVGSDRTYHADVRVIAATNRNLAAAVSEGEFREDLYYRLNVVNLAMPPLRDRGDDVLLLAEIFLRRFARDNNRELKGFSPEARTQLMSYAWPGNVRELINAVERSVILAQDQTIGVGELLLGMASPRSQDDSALHAGMTIREAERILIEKTLEATEGNRTRAADMLGITRKTLQNKIKEFGLPPA